MHGSGNHHYPTGGITNLKQQSVESYSSETFLTTSWLSQEARAMDVETRLFETLPEQSWN
jgi:hypothetical protein